MTDISKNAELQQSCITAVMHSADMIIKTSNLGYDMSFYKVSTNANTEQIKEAEFSGLIPTYRSSSTSIKQLKEACEKFGYSFEYEIIAERLNGWTDQVKELKIDYTAHYGNY